MSEGGLSCEGGEGGIIPTLTLPFVLELPLAGSQEPKKDVILIENMGALKCFDAMK
jgi:hypothetical protein